MLKNTKIKMIAFDLDGTLLNDKKEISKYTEDILNNIDIKKVIVTTRIKDNTKCVTDKVNIDGIVCSNGAKVIVDNNVIFESFISKQNYKNIIKMVFNQDKNAIIRVYGSEIIDIKFDNKNTLVNNLEKISVYIENKNKINEVLKKLSNYHVDFVENKYIIITNKEVSKYQSLMRILDNEKIKKDEVIYFGDDLNDLEIFKKMSLVVAPVNSHEKILNEATFICDSNNNDGVSLFLLQNIIKEVNDNLKFNGGSVAKIDFDKSKNMIKKSVGLNNEGINNGYTKLFYEAKHMQQYNKFNNKLYPDIYEMRKRGKDLVIKMEYLYHGVTLTDLLLNNKVGIKYIKNSLSYIVDEMFNKLYLKKKNIIPDQNYLEKNYFGRVSSRIETVKKILRTNNNYPRLKSAIMNGVILNGKYYPSILEYNDVLRNDSFALKKFEILNCTESHQDLIPSNIVLDFDYMNDQIIDFKLIDPRGEGDTGINNRHFTYDIGKLLFGFSGFELYRRSELKTYILKSKLIDGIYNYTFKDQKLFLNKKFDIARDILLNKLEKNKYKYFESIDLIDTYKEKILLAESYCFFADLPCRLVKGDNEEVLMCFYLKGIELLHEVVKMIYGKDVVKDI